MQTPGTHKAVEPLLDALARRNVGQLGGEDLRREAEPAIHTIAPRSHSFTTSQRSNVEDHTPLSHMAWQEFWSDEKTGRHGKCTITSPATQSVQHGRVAGGVVINSVSGQQCRVPIMKNETGFSLAQRARMALAEEEQLPVQTPVCLFTAAGEQVGAGSLLKQFSRRTKELRELNLVAEEEHHSAEVVKHMDQTNQLAVAVPSSEPCWGNCWDITGGSSLQQGTWSVPFRQKYKHLFSRESRLHAIAILLLGSDVSSLKARGLIQVLEAYLLPAVHTMCYRLNGRFHHGALIKDPRLSDEEIHRLYQKGEAGLIAFAQLEESMPSAVGIVATRDRAAISQQASSFVWNCCGSHPYSEGCRQIREGMPVDSPWVFRE